MEPIRNKQEADTQLESLKEKSKQLGMAYNRAFKSKDGRMILADMMLRYGWKDGVELPCYKFGTSVNDVISRDSMKEPVRYILRTIGGWSSNNPNGNEK